VAIRVIQGGGEGFATQGPQAKGPEWEAWVGASCATPAVPLQLCHSSCATPAVPLQPAPPPPLGGGIRCGSCLALQQKQDRADTQEGDLLFKCAMPLPCPIGLKPGYSSILVGRAYTFPHTPVHKGQGDEHDNQEGHGVDGNAKQAYQGDRLRCGHSRWCRSRWVVLPSPTHILPLRPLPLPLSAPLLSGAAHSAEACLCGGRTQ